MGSNEIPSEATIAATYGDDALVSFGRGEPMPLGFARQMEALACEGKPDRVGNPELRAKRLIKALHDGGTRLEPYHRQWLVEGD